MGCILFMEFMSINYSLSKLYFADYHGSCNCSMASSTVQSRADKPMRDDDHMKTILGSQVLVQSSLPATRVKRKLGPTFLLIMIPILFSSIKSRGLIRDTWYKGFSDSEDVMLRYIMGVNGLNESQINHLYEENKTHGDLVFLNNFTESVWALTNKTIAVMKWATENVDFTYLMKCDDDTFLFVNNTITELRHRSTTKRLYCGMMMYNHKPIHNKVSKWKDFQWDLSKKYTPFA